MVHYIHNINPILLDLPGPLAIRWYGLSYLAAFIGCILLLRAWSKEGGF
jgi:prolipoprotein diacylglyceryltransferase